MITPEDLADLARIAKFQTKLREAREQALEIYNDSLLFVFENGLFKADHNLIVFIRVLSIEKDEFLITDINNLPVNITSPFDFLDQALKTYHEATNAYYHRMEKIKQANTVEDLLL